MRIVLLGTVSSSIFGFRKLLLQSLVRAGHEVYILTTDLTPEIQNRARIELNVTAERYSLARSGINPLEDIRNAWRLYRRLKSLAPDFILCYFSKPVVWGAIASRMAGIEWRFGMLEGLGYYFTDEPDGISIKKKIIRSVQVLLFHISLPLLRGLVVLNPDDKYDLLEKYKVRARNVMVLGGIGLDLDEYQYREPCLDTVRFIFVGRLLAEKGINEFLQAAVTIKGKYPEVEFVVLGSEDPDNPGSVDIQYLQRLVDVGIITYPGEVSDVVQWLRASSVFVLPSFYREGVPRSTQEAMAVGMPIITTDVPGCRETIRDGYNGFIVPPHNSSAVAGAMEHFVTRPHFIVQMGRHSRSLAEENFDADDVNQRLFNFMGL